MVVSTQLLSSVPTTPMPSATVAFGALAMLLSVTSIVPSVESTNDFETVPAGGSTLVNVTGATVPVKSLGAGYATLTMAPTVCVRVPGSETFTQYVPAVRNRWSCAVSLGSVTAESSGVQAVPSQVEMSICNGMLTDRIGPASCSPARLTCSVESASSVAR